MIKGEDIKKLRKQYGLTQAQLSRALFVTESAVANWEADRRGIDYETLKKIANVFGYKVEVTLVKKATSKDEDFYKEKTFDEIKNMSDEELTDYIFITQSEKVIAKVCNIPEVVASSLELNVLNNLIKVTIEKTKRLVVYFKLNDLHEGLEEDIAILIEEVYEYMNEELPNALSNEVHYIDFDIYGDIYHDEIYSDCSRLLDKDMNDLEVDHEFIFESEFNPLIRYAQPMDVMFYIKDNPILQIKY